ncbi:MAG: hypothetical protein ACTSUQ_07580 [Candidatus Freyarchaeota archaeon]
MEPKTKAAIKGSIYCVGTFLVYSLIPIFVYNLIFSLIFDVFVLFQFAPPEYRNLLTPPIYATINVNFGAMFLYGVPIAVSAFFVGFYKGDTVGHALGGLSRQIFIGVWLLSTFGASSFIPFLLQLSIPTFVMTPTPPYFSVNYLKYMAPAFLDFRGILNLGATVIFLTSLIYVAELGVGLGNKDYWRYW